MANRRGGRGGHGGRGTELVAPSTALHSESFASMQPQVDLSPPVIEPENVAQTQSISVGSAAANVESTRNSNVRGITCGKGARKAMRNAKGRLTVQFNFALRLAICDNAEAFNNEIGYIARNDCSLRYKDWRFVTQEVRTPLRHKLLTLFDIDVEDKKVQEVIDSQMSKTWRSYRYKLHAHLKSIGGEKDPVKAKSIGHDEVSDEDWDYLCDLWSDSSYKGRAEKNAEARKKRKWESRNGSKSTARHHVGHEVELDARTGQIETWRIQHCDPEKGCSSQELEAKYEAMMQLRQDNQPENMIDKEILEKILGRHSNRLVGWGRSPSKSRGKCSDDSSRPKYNDILNELHETKSELREYNSRFEGLESAFLSMKQILIEKNVVPCSSLPRMPTDHGAGSSQPNASSNDDFDYDSEDIC
ncbi:hypothetical protein C2S52_013546 [Perilla frutescens var. hirtella]|nr:hypothetical protein C2S52_013546 [Perilla frutescens var. hirtella]